MQKTVVVAVSYVVWVPKYGVYEKRVSRHMVSLQGYLEGLQEHANVCRDLCSCPARSGKQVSAERTCQALAQCLITC